MAKAYRPRINNKITAKDSGRQHKELDNIATLVLKIKINLANIKINEPKPKELSIGTAARVQLILPAKTISITPE